MSYELTHAKRPEWLGGHNDAPPNLKPITEDELVSSTKFGTYHPVMIDFKQVIKTDEFGDRVGPMLSLHLMIYDDMTGVAYSTNGWAAYDRSLGIESERATMPAVQWYTFAGCEHKYGPQIKLGNCYYKSICEKCGYENHVDSSD